MIKRMSQLKKHHRNINTQHQQTCIILIKIGYTYIENIWFICSQLQADLKQSPQSQMFLKASRSATIGP